MEWIIVAIIGAVIGTLVSFLAQGLQMPQALAIGLGVLGGIAGGALVSVSQFAGFGTWTFYVTAALVALGLEAGGILAFTLTKEERRV